MRLLVVGAGSTGGYFGGRLAQAGQDVTFLVRERRAAQLREHGLQIVSPHGDATLHPKLVTAGEIAAPFDAVLLSVKAYALPQAIEDFAPAVGPTTIIMPVLNGMKHVDALVERFGEGAVIGGVCRVATTIDGEGRVVHLAPLQELIYGERDGGASARTAALHEMMQAGGFTATLSGTIAQDMWDKWVMLATVGGLNCLLGGAIGAIEAAGGAGVARRFLGEVAAIAGASGFPPGEAFMAATEKLVTTKGSPMATSMFRDMQGGLAVEAEQIIGDLCERGRALGVDTPLLDAARVRLGVYQAKLQGTIR